MELRFRRSEQGFWGRVTCAEVVGEVEALLIIFEDSGRLNNVCAHFIINFIVEFIAFGSSLIFLKGSTHLNWLDIEIG